MYYELFLIFDFIVILFFILLIYTLLKPGFHEIHHDHWYYDFKDLQFSSLAFYDSVQKLLEARKIPDMRTRTITLSEQGGIFSAERVYLRVKRGPYSFDICAAPFGIGFFISYWFGEDIGWWNRFLFKLPFLGKYFLRRYYVKTYYRLDTEAMFGQAVRTAIMDAIDALTTEKGLRALTELERCPKGIRQHGTPY